MTGRRGPARPGLRHQQASRSQRAGPGLVFRPAGREASDRGRGVSGSGGFGRGGGTPLSPMVRKTARRYLDAAVEQGTFDYVADFAGRLAGEVICELIGIPESDRSWVRDLIDTGMSHSGDV